MLVDFNKWAGIKQKKEVIKEDSSTSTTTSMPVHIGFDAEAMKKAVAALRVKAGKANRQFPESNWTMRRDKQAFGGHMEAVKMLSRATILQNILIQAEAGILPVETAHILVKLKDAQLELILCLDAWPVQDYNEPYRKVLERAGITSLNYAAVKRDVSALNTGQQEIENARKMWEQRTRIMQLRGGSLDFFPTPEDIADLMVEEVLDQGISNDRFSLCDPSAGTGNLIHAALKKMEPASVTMIEMNWELAEYLKVQKFNFIGNVQIVAADFLQMSSTLFDVILMNPPFKHEIEHVLHAFDNLAEGGILVTVMSGGIKFGSQKKTVEFRAWLDEKNALITNLPASSFASSGTGVSSILVTVRK